MQGDPKFMRRLNGWLTVGWICMIPVSIMLGLLSSVAYVSALSLWALVSGHWSAWQAARVEVQQMTEAEEREADPLEDRVVERLVAETNITAEPGSTGITEANDGSVRAELALLVSQVARLQRVLESQQPAA